MRLLMTTDTVGGVWTYSVELGKGLLERGDCLLLVTVGPAPKAEQRAWLSAAENAWPGRFRSAHVDAPLEWMEAGRDAYRDGEAALLQFCREFRPDVVHCNQFCYGALPLPAATVKTVVAHSDVLSWWRARYGESMPPSSWREDYVAQTEAGLAGADIVVAPTAASLAELQRSLRFQTEARVLWNGRTTASAERNEQDLLGNKTLQALTCGRLWDEGKNAGLLEGVIPCPLPLVIAGETREAAATLPAQAEVAFPPGEESAAAHRPCLTFTGHLAAEALERLMQSSAIYVVTSRYEPFGLAAVEAAQAGCAIVASDLASQRELWGDAALFFESDNPDSLRHALLTLAGDSSLLRRTAHRCRTLALQRFGREGMVNRYRALYTELHGRRARGGEGKGMRGVRVA